MVFLSPHRLESTEQSRQDVMPQAMLRADYTLRAFGDVHTPLSPAIPLCGVACFLTLRAEIPGINSRIGRHGKSLVTSSRARTRAGVTMLSAERLTASTCSTQPFAAPSSLHNGLDNDSELQWENDVGDGAYCDTPLDCGRAGAAALCERMPARRNICASSPSVHPTRRSRGGGGS
ncbi:hypothetical protein BKA93DRAFT_862379 [Sparassis latifolia]